MTDTFRQDLRLSLHSLLRARSFTIAALVMLMLGIGANTAIFSVLRAASLRATPLPDPERLAVIWTSPPGHPESFEGTRIVEFYAWKERSKDIRRDGNDAWLVEHVGRCARRRTCRTHQWMAV
jgi:hypothetical protein